MVRHPPKILPVLIPVPVPKRVRVAFIDFRNAASIRERKLFGSEHASRIFLAIVANSYLGRGSSLGSISRYTELPKESVRRAVNRLLALGYINRHTDKLLYLVEDRAEVLQVATESLMRRLTPAALELVLHAHHNGWGLRHVKSEDLRSLFADKDLLPLPRKKSGRKPVE